MLDAKKLRTNDQTVSLIANLQVAATRDQLIADIPTLARSHAGVPQGKCQLPRRDMRTATAAETPPDNEPSSSGAKKGEWLTGAGPGPSKTSAGVPPNIQNTDGTPIAVPRCPKSSLPIMGGAISTAPDPSAPRNASMTEGTASGSLKHCGKRYISSISGCGAADAAASASMMRRTAARTCPRTSSSKVRMLSVNSAEAGMMFSLRPSA